MIYALTINENSFAPAKFSTISVLLNIILPLATGGASLVCLVIMLLSAFKIMTNGDNPDVIKKSQTAIVYAGFGLVVVIASFLIVKLIGRVVGVDNILPQ